MTPLRPGIVLAEAFQCDGQAEKSNAPTVGSTLS